MSLIYLNLSPLWESRRTWKRNHMSWLILILAIEKPILNLRFTSSAKTTSAQLWQCYLPPREKKDQRTEKKLRCYLPPTWEKTCKNGIKNSEPEIKEGAHPARLKKTGRGRAWSARGRCGAGRGELGAGRGGCGRVQNKLFYTQGME